MFINKHKLSPYTAGIAIGLLQILALIFMGKMLGLSSSYAALSAHILTPFIDLTSYPAIEKYLGTSGTWQLSLAIGIMCGAYISSRNIPSKNHSPYWQTLGYTSPIVSITSFLGGFLLVFGARLAGGCTSGHGLSGLATFSLGSLITISTMFASAILCFLIFKNILGRPTQ